MFFRTRPKRYLDQGQEADVANKSSFMLAVLLVANPFMLLFFQNCSVIPTYHAQANPPKASAAAPGQKEVSAQWDESKQMPH